MALAVPLAESGWASLPRHHHLEQHIEPELREWVPFLLEPRSLEEVARRRGPGWTRRQAEYALTRILNAVPVESPRHTPFQRLALLRIAYGLDWCWCEL